MVEYDDNLLEPVSFYENTLKQRVKEAAEDHFEKLVKKANINVEENIETVKKYDSSAEILAKELKKLKQLKGKRSALYAIGIIALIVGIALILFASFEYLELSIGLGVGIPLTLAGIACIIINIVVFNKKIKAQQKVVDKSNETTQQYLSLAQEQMKPLYNFYDYGIAYEIFDEAVDIINFDKFFDKAKLRYLVEKCDYDDFEDDQHTTLYVKSGEILGNPFILKKTKFQTMINKTYTGSRVVTYVESYTDGEGHYRTRTVTETLHAAIQKPAPYYGAYTDLIYGNQAAPDLSFSRRPTGLKADMKEKEKDKFLRKKSEELQNMAEEALRKGDHFQPLANTEFEVYFDALDRNNESQFRLLFTPLAQKNYRELFSSPHSFGDDFEFIKKKRTNFISSVHTQSMKLTAEPQYFISHSYEIAKELFVGYITKFFKALYFDFAPLMSIPLYQQLKTEEYIYETELESNNTMFEAEMIANRFDENDFANIETADTAEQILKAHFVEKNGNSDKVVIRAHSFRGEERIEYVVVRARNGDYFDVPVHWIEYFPIHEDTTFQVKRVDTTRPEYISKAENDDNDFSKYIWKYKHEYFDKLFGLFVNVDRFDENDDSDFNNVYNK